MGSRPHSQRNRIAPGKSASCEKHISHESNVAIPTAPVIVKKVFARSPWQETAYSNIQAVRPGMPVLKLSAKTGEGIEEYLRFLAARLIELRQAAAV